MADIPLELINASGGGEFVPKFFSGTLQVAAGGGVGVTIFTLTPPSGERVRLENLNNGDTVSHDLQVDGVNIITALALGGNSDNIGEWSIANSGAGLASASGNLQPLIGGVDEVIKLIRQAASGANPYRYSYSTGVIK